MFIIQIADDIFLDDAAAFADHFLKSGSLFCRYFKSDMEKLAQVQIAALAWQIVAQCQDEFFRTPGGNLCG